MFANLNHTMDWPSEEMLLTLQQNQSLMDCQFQESIATTNYSAMVLEFAKILYGIVFLVGLFGNSLVIYVVMRFSKMQTVTNMYILNLAIADEMFLIGLVFLITTFIYKYWMFGRLLCKIYMTITSINQFTSSLLLTVMSADRYIAGEDKSEKLISKLMFFVVVVSLSPDNSSKV